MQSNMGISLMCFLWMMDFLVQISTDQIFKE